MSKKKDKNIVNTEVNVENKVRAHASKKDGTAKNEIKDKNQYKYVGSVNSARSSIVALTFYFE